MITIMNNVMKELSMIISQEEKSLWNQCHLKQENIEKNLELQRECKCQYKNVQKRENSNVQKEEYYMFNFSSSKCSNLSLILYDNPFILTIVE